MADEQAAGATKKFGKFHNILPIWGNESTMNLNPLILTNIQGSSYFKVHLFKLKTYHEVVDEIYYQVKHLEPWERGSRKTAGQTGMCGGVRGVGAGGIVSTAYCLLYKLYTLRLTRKQVNGLLTHTDSPYIRALGFMYIRYTQPPADLYDWYEPYLQDEEEIEVKAGGGQSMVIGNMLIQWLLKLDWFSTLFPRIPVPIQKQIEQKLDEYARDYNLPTLISTAMASTASTAATSKHNEFEGTRRRDERGGNEREPFERRREPERRDRVQERYRDDERRRRTRSRSRSREHRNRNRDTERHIDRKDRDRDRDRERKTHHRGRDYELEPKSSRERSHERSRHHRR